MTDIFGLPPLARNTHMHTHTHAHTHAHTHTIGHTQQGVVSVVKGLWTSLLKIKNQERVINPLTGSTIVTNDTGGCCVLL